jgi:3-phosphoshikimate 1-carboxyvinyltransferase
VKIKLLKNRPLNNSAHIKVSGSKSESNRVLILDYVLGDLSVSNLSNSDDTTYLKNALGQLKSNQKQLHIDVGHAGTAMRFLTALCAVSVGQQITLSGSERMHQRPVKPLVDALIQLGADIKYLGQEGYPPLQIQGKKLVKSEVSISAEVSSQYITALMLISPKLPKGLILNLIGKITSRPYIEMTKTLLENVGYSVSFKLNSLEISNQRLSKRLNHIEIESDWSSASYHYALMAFAAEGEEIKLSNYRSHSIQGDAKLKEMYTHFGVRTIQSASNQITLQKVSMPLTTYLEFDLIQQPDLAQSIAVTCAGLGISCRLTGLKTLKIKETDRLHALKAELEKLGVDVKITSSTLQLQPPEQLIENVSISTYNDHRMALAFSSLALVEPIQIQDPNVVTKSYPNFWDHLKIYGIQSFISN